MFQKYIHVQVSGHHRFVSLIDKLISKVGFHKVVAGHVTHAYSSRPEETIREVPSRAWLAAEVLCTWKWPGGNALDSFLPFLCSYAKNINLASRQNLLDSIFNILLDGALVHGGNSSQSLFDIWPPLDDKVEVIEEPFLRAHVCLLVTLLENDIWERDKAMILYDLLVNKLFIGEAINKNCLRILPPIFSVLVRTLSYRGIGSDEYGRRVDSDTSEGNQVRDAIRGWLQRSLLFPPLVAWQSGEGKACYFQFIQISNRLVLLICLFYLVVCYTV